MSTARYDVAIHAPSATPLYVAGGGSTGGAELQMTMLARALAGRGLRTAHIVFDREGLPRERDGVALVPELARQHSNGRIRTTLNTFGSLSRADAALYVQRSAGWDTGVVAAHARAKRRPFVFSVSSTVDLTLDRTDLVGVSRRMFQLGAHLASAVVVQSEEQLALARERGLSKATLIPSICEVPARSGAAARECFLWIGGLIDYKDPLSFVELARRVPEATFVMVASERGPLWEGLSGEVRAEAARLPNLELLPARGRADLLPLYEGAVAVANTSQFEGMPNTFLEGWARGAPALSLRIDPGGVIERNSLGLVAGGSLDRMAEQARELWSRRDDQAGEEVRQYVERHHHPEVVAGLWHELIEHLT
jgi:glycosyltransferase involved in cell wall biosynthesis